MVAKKVKSKTKSKVKSVAVKKKVRKIAPVVVKAKVQYETLVDARKKYQTVAEVRKSHKYFWVYTMFPFTYNTINCQIMTMFDERIKSGQLDDCLAVPILQPSPILIS